MEHASLLVDVAVAMLLMSIVTVIHGTGISFMDRLFRTEARELWKLPLLRREVGVMVPMALCLLLLHMLEIFVFALFYLGTGDAQDLRDGLYHSALAYTTMGITEGGPTKWALVTAFEGLAGFLLIGWSSAVFVTDMERVLRHRRAPPDLFE